MKNIGLAVELYNLQCVAPIRFLSAAINQISVGGADAGEGSSDSPVAAPSSPAHVRLLLQVLLPEEDIAAAAARRSPSSAAIQSTSARHVD